ncbi:TPA: hypothetical protein ACGQG5_004094 [Escherichia coli]|nr:hypothetical protein [Escherichia coli]ELI8976745.1 hypothetical protein [Escherichia coli]MCN5708019.1 hypothetical protein [Escherichia coli]MCN5851630.1 hypothetical protein [Escherichia coli]MCN6152917.1 hypothetical protein [Escherichia coli]MCO0092191.1 hypothetical protein [Escherichia coli]
MSVKQSSKLIAVITTGLKAAPKPVQLWFALIMNLSAESKRMDDEYW